MAILGFFKKDKSKASSSQASSSSPPVDDTAFAEDYVLSPPSLTVPSAGNGDDGYASSAASFVSAASSKKMRLPFSRKKSMGGPTSPLTRPSELTISNLDVSPGRLSLSLDTSLDKSPIRAPAFPSYHISNSAPSLPRLDASSRPQPIPMQKLDVPSTQKTGGGLFSWRERKKSKPTKPDPEALVLPPLPNESFNLKSFRHVVPEPRPNSPQNRSPAQSSPPSSLVPPARPRGSSVASTDSSQRISVAAFREAQARRSSTNLVSGSPSPTIRPVSVANSAISDIASTRPPRGVRPPASAYASPVPTRGGPSRQSKMISSSSDASSSEESESEDCSPSRSRPRSRLGRQRTITRRSYGASSDVGHGGPREVDYSHHQQTTSSRSELGHGSFARPSHASPSPSRGPPPSSFLKTDPEAGLGTRSFSLYRRQRASYSTSELNPNAAAQRASSVVEANKRELAAQRRADDDSDTSDSSSDSDSSDDDAPLAALRQPKRPGSTVSHGSYGSPGPSRKPLIDLNTNFNPITGKPLMDTNEIEQQKARATLISPTNINGRLTQLTMAAGLGEHRKNSASKSEANLSRMTSPRPSFVDNPKPDSPASTDTITPPLRTESPKPMPANPRRASVSVLSSAQGIGLNRTDDLRPIPVKDRPERNTGFRVVSRPQKSATTPPSFLSQADPSPSQPSKEPTAAPYHRQPSSSSFNVTSRPQSSMAVLSTTPHLAASQKGSSTSASMSTSSSSVSGSSASARMTAPMQKSPQKPFVFGGKRQESPASSTGGSSNGKAPLTPMDGSDYFSPSVRGSSGDSPGGSSVGATPPSAMKGGRGHMKRASVSFQETVDLDQDDTIRGRKSSSGPTKVDEQGTIEERENRRRERRRSEAKAAIELGNVINGRGPLENEDDNDSMMMAPQMPPMNPRAGMGLNFSNIQMGWQQQGMPSPLMGMGGVNPLAGGPAMGMGMGMNMGMSPQQFMVTPPPPGADPAFMAAHQQAMRIAKQAYQYAVAQQAMAAAADEWERGSSVSAFTSPAGPVNLNMGMGGYGMGGMNGMNGMWGGGSQMFPAAPRSMYGGSNNGGAMSEAGWGTASVYGESFGPSMSANARRSQVLSNHARNPSGGSAAPVSFPGSSYQRAESSGNVQQIPSRPAPRPRTRTAPSNAPLPTQHRGRGPPSSWKVGS